MRLTLVAVLVFAFVAAGSGSASGQAEVHRYDVTVSGMVTTRDVRSGTSDSDGTTEVRLSYELVFQQVAVTVNPQRRPPRIVVSAARMGTASGRFELESRVGSSVCSGSFSFAGLDARLGLQAFGPQVKKPRFVLRALLTPGAFQEFSERVQLAKSGCPNAAASQPQAPGGDFAAAPGVRGAIGSFPSATFRRQNWQPASPPVRQLRAGRAFTLDTGAREETTPDRCDLGSCVRQLGGRVSVQFRPAG